MPKTKVHFMKSGSAMKVYQPAGKTSRVKTNPILHYPTCRPSAKMIAADPMLQRIFGSGPTSNRVTD